MTDWVTLAACTAAMILAGGLHGLSGTGFALIAMPLLTALLGVHEGLRVGFVAALTVCVFALVGMWRDVQLRRGLALATGGLALVPLGFLAVRSLPAPALLITVGALVLVSLALARWRRPAHPTPVRVRTLFAVGAVGGAIHVTSALSAPVFTAYALRTNWPGAAFSATMQVVFITFNVGSIALWGFPFESIGELGVLLPAMLVGLAGGLLLRRRTTDAAILTVATIASILAALIAIAKGVVDALAG